MDPLLIDTQPDSVAAWLERLPFTDLPECGRLLSQSMQNLSRVPLDSHLRHKLLKLYLKAVDRYYPLLENEIRQHDSLGTPKVRQLALLSVELFALIFITFKQTLHDRLAKRGLLDREHPKIELMAYTMMMAARQLLSISQQCYSPITPDFWYDCHQLHVFASGHGWQDKGLANDDSIHTIYLQILLMGLTPSNRLAPTEQALSRQLIFDLAAKAQLIPVEALTQPVHGYLVDQQIDSPPRFLPISASKLGPGCFLLDLEPLRDILEKSREALQKAQNNQSPARPDGRRIAVAILAGGRMASAQTSPSSAAQDSNHHRNRRGTAWHLVPPQQSELAVARHLHGRGHASPPAAAAALLAGHIQSERYRLAAARSTAGSIPTSRGTAAGHPAKSAGER
ncbi:hypothetical protein JOS77_16045 [Chromobacterium haemolyticum]|nr:hypothetical protein JOS77_16045 [Chromobacterium haemolyticum]